MHSATGHAGYITPNRIGPSGVQFPAAVGFGTAIVPSIRTVEPVFSDWLWRRVRDVAFVVGWLLIGLADRLSSLSRAIVAMVVLLVAYRWFETRRR